MWSVREDIREKRGSAQCDTRQSRTPQSRKINFFFLKIQNMAYTAPRLTPRSVIMRGVEFFELSILISSWKRIFKHNHFSLFIRGPDGVDSWKKWRSKISWHRLFNVFFPSI